MLKIVTTSLRVKTEKMKIDNSEIVVVKHALTADLLHKIATLLFGVHCYVFGGGCFIFVVVVSLVLYRIWKCPEHLPMSS